MTLEQQIQKFKEGDETMKKILLPRAQRASTFLINKINDTDGGYAAIKDDPVVQQSVSLIDTVMGSDQLQFLIVTSGVSRDISQNLHNKQ